MSFPRNRLNESVQRARGEVDGKSICKRKQQISLASALPRGIGPPDAAHLVCWQVFGLSGFAKWGSLCFPTNWRFPNRNSVLMPIFVPNYRCGAVLEFHQIPCCLNLRAGRTSNRTNYIVAKSDSPTTCSDGVSKRYWLSYSTLSKTWHDLDLPLLGLANFWGQN